MSQFTETHGRSVAKALSWRVLGTVATSAIVFAFTGKWALSLFVGGLEFVLKIGLFWVHERAWDQLAYGRRAVKPSVIWFTGLSGSGKSTISQQVTQALQNKGLKVEHLDGDSVRGIFPNTGFTRPERDSHIRRVGFLASKLEEHGVFVVASFVSPYREARGFVRELCRNFIEVHVSTPLEVCEARDVKGLYAKARRGEISSFTGISDPYEPPTAAELVIDASRMPVPDAVATVLAEVQRRTNGAMA
jgi:adenylylsulfate kinase